MATWGFFLPFGYAPAHQKKTWAVAWERLCVSQKNSDAFAANNSGSDYFDRDAASLRTLHVANGRPGPAGPTRDRKRKPVGPFSARKATFLRGMFLLL